MRKVLKLLSLKSSLFWIFLPSYWTLPPQAIKHTQSSHVLGRKLQILPPQLYTPSNHTLVMRGLFKEKLKSLYLVPDTYNFFNELLLIFSAFILLDCSRAFSPADYSQSSIPTSFESTDSTNCGLKIIRGETPQEVPKSKPWMNQEICRHTQL